MTTLQFSIYLLSEEKLVLHFFSSLRSNFSLDEMHLAASLGHSICQIERTMSINHGMRIQWFSNLKTAGLGINEPIETTQGTWSDVGRAKGETKVLGNLSVHAVEEKN